MDSACHRLSRVPQKFSSSKAVQSEKSEPFAVTYFKNNPDAAQDIRPPDEKLSDIETALQGQLQASEKFSLLVQQKALRFINYGENSPEAFRSFLAIGAFYNEQKRPDSAIRHLNKAKSLEDQQKCEVSPDEDAQLAVELADAHLSYKTQKHTKDAFEALRPHIETEIEDIKYRHRRDLYLARCYNYMNELENAQEPYRLALETYDEAHTNPNQDQENQDPEKENEQKKANLKEQGRLYCEAADAAERLEDIKAAKQYYRDAHRIYSELGDEQATKGLEIKIETLGPDEEEEEEQAQEEAEQQQEEQQEQYNDEEQQQQEQEQHEEEDQNENAERDANVQNEEEEASGIGSMSLQKQIVDKIEDNAQKEDLL